MMKSAILKLLVTVLFFIGINCLKSEAQITFPVNSSYKYLKGSAASSLTSSWVNSNYNDASWLSGNAPFRYGDGTGGTELLDMQGNYSTVYLRTKFMAAQANLIQTITVKADWDDGFVLFINGIEVISRQAPAALNYDALASGMHEFGEMEAIAIPTTNLNLIDGENTIAVYCCNITLAESSDFYFDISMNATTVQPGVPELVDTVGITFDNPSGFYQSNFTLTMTTSVADAAIVYTLDGSNPQISATRIEGSSTAQVLIDPSSTANRGTTPAVVVRASIIKEGYIASKPELRTYIFLEKVNTQAYPGWDWPASNVNGQHIDLPMDPDVANSAEYKSQMEASLLDIPTISLVTDNSSLFNADSGIYVNAMDQGPEWERQCAVELINPDGSDGFNVNAGLRIRGGWSRHDEYPKHAFRLFFRGEYGVGKLNFPLFGNEGVTQFDKIDLRCEQNYSWSNWDGVHNTFVREVFTRDAQGETGSPYTRSRYYHLYLNGMYWGLFQTQERCDANFAADYIGGTSGDWDVIKIGGVGEYDLFATDGNLDKWRQVWDITQQGYSENTNYFKLDGKNSLGEPVKNSEILVDIDNLIDYMISIFYTGNYDSPVSAFGNNKHPNNMYAIKNRNDKTSGFKFLVHDAEHVMMVGYSSGPGIGLQENRVDIGYRTGGDKMVVYDFEQFHTQWLHHKLVENKEYRVRFADKAWKRLNNFGIYSEDSCIVRAEYREAQVEKAVIAESARWGDAKTGTPFTQADWQKEMDVLKYDYFPYRAGIVIDQLKQYELFPAAPDLYVSCNGTDVWNSPIFINTASTIRFSASSGDIYFTLTGEDPRLIGGTISPNAIKITSGNSITISESAVIKARVLNNEQWSSIREVDFIAEQNNYSKFKVTELHYNPTDSIIGMDTISGDNYEFIEFKNTGFTSAINLTGLEFVSGIVYKFPDNTLLAPQEYFVIAAKPKKLYDKCGMVASGNFSDNFSNGGEEMIILNSKGKIVLNFTYNNSDPWPIEPDGKGHSLVSKLSNPDEDPNDNSYWKSSVTINGSPFQEDGLPSNIDKNPDYFLSNNYLIYPNPTNGVLHVDYTDKIHEKFNVKIYDIRGALLLNRDFEGNGIVSLNEMDFKYGVYLLKIESVDFVETTKVIYAPF